MKYLILILSITAFMAADLFSQQEVNEVKTDIPPLNGFIELQNKLDNVEFYFDLTAQGRDAILNENSETVWLWTLMSLKHQTGSNGNSLPSHISLPLYREYLEASKINPLTYVLGVAQASAAGYLAYKSIKKYGLFR